MWSSEDEQEFLQGLQNLPKPQTEMNGTLKFEFFIEFLSKCDFKGKNLFDERKKELCKERRTALQAKDDPTYSKKVVEMMKEEEKTMGQVIQEALKTLNIQERDFHQCMMMSQHDQKKGMQIQELQNRMFDTPEDELLNEAKALDIFRKQHNIMMTNVEEKGEDIAKGMQPPKSQEEHRTRIEKSMTMQCKEADQLFFDTGVEQEILDASIDHLELFKHPDFEAMAKEGSQKMNEAVKKAMIKYPPPQNQGQNGGPGMGGPPGGGFNNMEDDKDKGARYGSPTRKRY